MKIKDRPEFKSKPRPLTRPSDTTVAEAVAEMSAKNYGSIVVTDAEGKVKGLVTERDIMKRLVNESRDPRETRLSDIMTTDLRMAHADDDITEWLRIMSNERFRRLPVVDSHGQIVSIMTQGDFVSYTWPDLFRQGKEMFKATAGNTYQIIFIVGSVMVYTLLVLFALRLILP